MKNEIKRVSYKRLGILVLILIMLFASTMSFGQDEEAEQDQSTDDEDDVVELEPVVATGSRLLRETYESISPVQVITAQQSRAVGQIDATDVLQHSTAASGQQIDLSFSGFVLNNGPGSQTISFRGLGPGRTLVMLNGRRMGPSGVEGVPTSPDLSLVPGALIQRYELLLDGSSSLYGSDAVAGVANAILRKDFDGFEVDFTSTIPEQSGGIEATAAVTWGKNYDRGFIGFGAQVVENDSIAFADRSWTSQCSQNREIDAAGNITSIDLASRRDNLVDVGPCIFNNITGRIFIPGGLGGSLYFTPGVSNGGWGNFSESHIDGLPLDSDGDGQNDINFLDYDSLPAEDGAMLRAELKTQNIMSYGEYTFEGDNNITPFFELLYSRRDTYNNSGSSQFAPTVPALNPYNLCNPGGVNGVDCGLAHDALYENPAVIAAYLASTANGQGCDPSADGDCPQAGGPSGAIAPIMVQSVIDDRNAVSVTVKQYRALVGVKGDLPGIDFGQMSNWNFETYLSHHLSDGIATRAGIRSDRLNYSLNTSRIDPNTGEVICGSNNGCVPINLFAPSLFGVPYGDFATQAERDYLFDLRTFRTKIKQTIFSGFINGFVYELPAGPLAAGVGIELREDEIESIPDEVARDGLLQQFFSDAGAVGKKSTKEIFAEVEVPLLAGYKGVEELTFNVSGRLTKDEFFPHADTFSAKLGYRPIPSLLFKATVGTSYRAPNLRENFLLAQSGFNNISDPCSTPQAAIGPNGYDPTLDSRDPELLQNCINDGVDPTNFRIGLPGFYQVEITTGGSTNVTEEKSDSLTYGFAWDVPFLDETDLTIGATYYEIEIDNTIVASTTGQIINGCYGTNGNQTLCNRITRDGMGNITNVDSGFINRDNNTVRGVDVNFNADRSFDVFGKPVDFGLDLIMTHLKENSTLFLGEPGPDDDIFTENKGSFGFPSWQGTFNLRAAFDNYRINWQTSYLGHVEQPGVDPFSDIDDSNNTGFTSQTCIAPNSCRDVGFAKDYYLHTLSVFYDNNDWTLGFGVRNLFNKAPPEVDPAEVFAIGNAPIGVGYDINGRRYFLNISRRF